MSMDTLNPAKDFAYPTRDDMPMTSPLPALRALAARATPGPWWPVFDDRGPTLIQCGVGNIARLNAPNGQAYQIPQTEPNARLLALAPHLLPMAEALEAALPFFAEDMPNGPDVPAFVTPEYSGAYRKALAALSALARDAERST